MIHSPSLSKSDWFAEHIEWSAAGDLANQPDSVSGLILSLAALAQQYGTKCQYAAMISQLKAPYHTSIGSRQ